MSILEKFGATERFVSQSSFYPEWTLARVISQSRERYRIATEQVETAAEVSGRFRHEAAQPSDYPAVGDFVMVTPADALDSPAMIHRVLPRRSVFKRRAAGDGNTAQVVAANIDVVFICMSLNHNCNPSRLERYLAVAWESGATPVVVLTKADLCRDPADALAELTPLAPGVDFVVTGNVPGSWGRLLAYLRPGVTASLIGSSGVGKSTLINRLTGQELLTTADIGWEDRGRHTTTRRELIPLPQGGVVIDTPGMRELGVETVNLAKTFTDIDTLAGQCRFGDCTHTGEPGCAVRRALETGALDARRLENYQKLKREARYDGLNARERETEKINAMFGNKHSMKQLKDWAKEKNGRR